jgi:hypothetical protein
MLVLHVLVHVLQLNLEPYVANVDLNCVFVDVRLRILADQNSLNWYFRPGVGVQSCM